jgi:hypothetical protein
MKDAELSSPVPVEQQVDTDVNGGVSVDHERLRYVTGLLGSQKGLNTALFGAFYFFISIDRISGWSSVWSSGLALLVALAFFLAAHQRWVPRYYERRFGFVQPQEPSAWWFGLLLLTIVLLLFIGQPLAHYLDPKVAGFVDWMHLKISDPVHQIDLSAPFLWIAVSLSGLRWHIRSWERPQLSFLLCGLVAFSLIAAYGIWHPDARQVWFWKVLNAGGFGLSLMAMGLYDHVVLIRALPKRVGEGDDE